MKAYIAIKFHPDGKNKDKVEDISKALKQNGIEPFCFVRDIEKFSKNSFTAKELMQKTFEAIDSCDLMVVDLTEKGVGLGIEAGYAHAKGIPIITIAEKGSDISKTLQGISKEVILYDKEDDLASQFK
jgi:nucleoside 2-deoxyribosyltransferase